MKSLVCDYESCDDDDDVDDGVDDGVDDDVDVCVNGGDNNYQHRCRQHLLLGQQGLPQEAHSHDVDAADNVAAVAVDTAANDNDDDSNGCLPLPHLHHFRSCVPNRD